MMKALKDDYENQMFLLVEDNNNINTKLTESLNHNKITSKINVKLNDQIKELQVFILAKIRKNLMMPNKI